MLDAGCALLSEGAEVLASGCWGAPQGSATTGLVWRSREGGAVLGSGSESPMSVSAATIQGETRTNISGNGIWM